MLILGLQKTTLLDYPGKVASTIFTGGCNFRCPYCHNKDLVVEPGSMTPFSEEEIFDHLTKKKKVLDGVCITGGEPTLQHDLVDFIKKIKALGLLVKLDTNGTNPSLLKELIDAKLIDYVAMDIKSSKEHYNDVACMNGFDASKIDESIQALLASDIDYEFRTTVVKELHTSSDFESIANWINGAKAYYLQAYKESDQVINPIFTSPTKEDLETFKSIVSPKINHVEIRGID